jgi:C1A family cysteine protease
MPFMKFIARILVLSKGDKYRALAVNKGLGCIPSPKDNRDYKVEEILSGTSQMELPDHVEILGFNPIKQQGAFQSCVSFAACAELERLKNDKAKGKDWDLSEMYVWNKTRALDGALKNTGVYIRDALKVLQEHGASLEEFFPYEASRAYEEVSWLSDVAARGCRVKNYYRVNSWLDAKLALVEGHCPIIGMKAYQNFADWNTNMVYSKESGNYLGGHAVLLCGFRDDIQAFKVRNSWGSAWGGMNGYAWISYDAYQKLCYEAFVITMK